ncbi:MAG: hypothetical protein QOI16_3700, partial [Pseudonocardiales bacterium]|nr:hypothetical protein [Pseudonocardiales bacterium]
SPSRTKPATASANGTIFVTGGKLVGPGRPGNRPCGAGGWRSR